MTDSESSQPATTLAIEQAFQQAIAHHQAGRLQEAGELYRTILQTHPNHPETNYNMGVLAVQMKQPTAGLSYFMAALDADPARGQYWLSYIDALFQSGQLEDARQVLELALQHGLEGDDVEALALRLEGESPTARQPPAEDLQAIKEPPPIPPAAQESTNNPGPLEINKLLGLFNQGRYTEAAAFARTMTERFPLHEFGWKALGAVFKQLGRSEDALEPMRKAAELSPSDVEAHYNLGATLQDLGRLDEAETSYRRALQINPDYADAHSNLGVILQELSRLDEAETSYRRVLEINPDNAEAHSNLGVTLQGQGRLDEAEASLRRALRINPDNAAAHNNLGSTLHDLGRLDEAEASYRRALQINPDYTDAHCNMGKTIKALGRTNEAEASYRRAIQISPNYAEAHYNLGNTLKDLGRLKEAEASYRQALEIKPDFAEAHCNLGVTLKELGRLDEAEASLRRALQIKPDYAKALSNLGTALQDLDRLDEAEASYRRALQIIPDYAQAHSNLGSVLQRQRRLDEAEASYRRAIQIKPDFAEAHSNLAGTLQELGRLAEAETCSRRALEIAPECAAAHQNLAIALAYLSDFDQVVTECNIAQRIKSDDAADWEQRLYLYSYHPDLTAQEIYAEFVRWGDRFPDPAVDFSAHDRTPGRRLRVGYVSPDFRRHTSRFFFWPLFAHHDHAVVELYAYSNVGHEDEFTQEFKGLFDHWRNIRGIADSEVARMIREDGIDILVDGCSHMRDDRLGVFTLKPAPIQATWLGAAWTTGLKMIDYALIDPYMAPEGTLTRETIVRLPHSFVAYRPPEETAEIAPPPCLKNGYITFGYSGRTERLNHHTFRAWGEILRQNPTARLILDFRSFADPLTQERYRQFMVRHGMDPSQVIMRKSDNIFAGLNDMDILLDSFPHSGGTMLFDALWMGVPILTLASRPPVGRIGTSLMINLGLPEWVAETQEEYIGKASALAQDVQALAQLRAGMRERMQNSPLMDGPGFARGVEAAFREMFEKWASEPPPPKEENPSPQEIDTLVATFSEGRLAEAATLAGKMTVRFPLHWIGWKMLGVVLKQMGRSADALAPMQKAAALSPGDAEAHNNLGIILNDLGRLDEAEASYRRALQSNPNYAQAHSNLGATLQDLNRLDEAEACYRRALQIAPDYAKAHSNLGATLHDLGRPDEAEASYRRALQINPEYAEAHYNLGITLKDLGRPDEAMASYRRALEIEPNYPEAYSNLGTALQDLDRLDEAEACYRRALEIKPDFADALNHLAWLLNAQGQSMTALNVIKQSLQIKETGEAKSIFVACIRHLSFTHDDHEIRGAMVRALTEPWSRPSELARISADLVKLNPDIGECMARAVGAWPRRLSAQDLFGPKGLTAAAADPLLCALLDSAPICDLETERFLTMARRAMLEAAIETTDTSEVGTALSFYAALARQCYINEYVFSYTDDEIQKASALRDTLAAAQEAKTEIPALWPLAVAAYFPLHTLPLADRLLERSWPETVTAVLVQQVREPEEEQQLRATIPRLTRIEDEVSLRVQNQYEENPYPRWIKTAPAGAAKNIDGYLCQKFPLATFKRRGNSGRIDILVAGCGTGQHPIATARRIQGAQVLAVDLSMSSLSYAKRKTQELGLTSIEYAQADLLKLGTLDRSFDVIESSGVLHHLADPWAGWRALLSLLRAGGFMKLGFYSEVARRNIVRIRALIAERGYASTAEDIRRCRQDLMNLDKSADFGTTTNSPDFFSISACRDLLFHVQEHRMTLTDINAFLGGNNLQFLGFEIETPVLHAYKQRFPDDRAATDLGQWQIFEDENPDTFAGMYQFWVQKGE